MNKQLLQQCLDVLSDAFIKLSAGSYLHGYHDTIEALRAELEKPEAEAIGEVESAIFGASGFHSYLYPNHRMPKVGDKLFTAACVSQQVSIDQMVNRFLGWKFPRHFAPDGGITFSLTNSEGFDLPGCWPIGTNLFTADQARAMFEYCLADASTGAGNNESESEVVAWARLRADGRAPDVAFQETAPDESYDFPLYTSPPDTEALRKELERVKGERDDMHQHMKRIKHCLMGANEQANGPICDTIWYSECETLFDYIDAAIAAQEECE